MSKRLRIALAAGLSAAALGTVAATGYGDPSGLSVTPLAHATLAGPVRAHHAGIAIRTRGRRDVLVARIDIAAGGTTGWHSHPGPVIVAVASGTLTLHHPTRHHGCQSETFGAGHGFIENGSDIHAATAGDEPVVIYATFLAKVGTPAASYLAPVPTPAGC